VLGGLCGSVVRFFHIHAFGRRSDLTETGDAKMCPDKSQDEMLAKILESPSYRVAYEDLEFLGREELRPVPLQLELLKPQLALQEHEIRSTIVVFGSTRIVSPEIAEADLAEARRIVALRPNDSEAQRRMRVAERILAKSKYYTEAREFGRIVSSTSQLEHKCDYVIITGGGPGIMEASNRGAWEAGGKSIGLNITLPHEQNPNPYITPDLCFQFHYFAIRKMHFLIRAMAMVAFPGGYGTCDELFETLTLIQTRKVKPIPVLLFGEEYWRRTINFQYMVDEGTIDPEDLELFRFVEKAEEAWQVITDFYGGNR
jgi:uncharacterized protein (TIGR00730 family)